MIGWIVLGLFLAGVAIMWWSVSEAGAGGEERMSDAIVGGFGFILIAIAVLIALGAGLWNLF